VVPDSSLLSLWVVACAYGFLSGAWPFGVVEAIWTLIAIHRFWEKTHGSVDTA
jgi:hypothetical protein